LDCLSNYSPEVRKLATRLRSLIKECVPAADEQPDPATRINGYGFGLGYKGLICTIILSKFQIKLGFYRGAELPDPEGLLTGKGKVHKHVVIGDEDELSNPALRRLLLEAASAAKARNSC
jgi:hypothetical protein